MGSTCGECSPRPLRRPGGSAPSPTDQHLRGIIECTVAPAFAVRHGALWAGTRGRPAEAFARQVAMYLLREETGISLAEIGSELGGRDHTTVMHGIEKIERELGTDTALRAHLMAIREALFTASVA